MSWNKHSGSSFDGFLDSEGLLEESAALAVKRVIVWQVASLARALGAARSGNRA